MLCLSGFELCSRWVPLFKYNCHKIGSEPGKSRDLRGAAIDYFHYLFSLSLFFFFYFIFENKAVYIYS